MAASKPRRSGLKSPYSTPPNRRDANQRAGKGMMKKLLVAAAICVGFAGPAYAWSGTDQDGTLVEIDPHQTILPGIEIEILLNGELRSLSVESLRRVEDGMLIEGRREDDSRVMLRMKEKEPDEPGED